MSKTRFTIVLCAALAAVIAAPPAPAGECGDPGTPASIVPQFRSENPGQSIWPVDNLDEVIFKPASEIPRNRDSTDYITQTIPGNQSGHELFQDVAALEGNDDWLFVAYNAGFQVWDLRTNPANPSRSLFRDGWIGGIEIFPGFGEGDTYIEAIDVIQDPSSSNIFIAVAGRSGHGISIHRFNPVSETSTQIFQNSGLWFRDVELIHHANGRIYAIAPANDSSFGGVHVFDVTSANASPCFEEGQPGTNCSYYEGTIGNIGRTAYIDTVRKDVGETWEIYLAVSDGAATVSSPLRAEIWLIIDPENPGTASRKFTGLDTNTRGIQIFKMGSDYFIAVIDAISATNTVNRVYNVTSCLDANGCSSIGNALWSFTNRPISGNFQFLTVSQSGTRTFLYYGLETTPLNGARVEQLFDISSLAGIGGGSVFEITDAGADYTDPCTGATIDYWGDYYGNNAYGLDNLLPRHGIFIDKYFYRAAIGVLDVHELVQDDPVSSIVSTVGSGPFWMGDGIAFGTLPGGNCSPSAGQWCWLVEPEAGHNISYSPLPSNTVTGCDSSYTGNQTFTFTCDGPGRCDDTFVGATAWNLSCGSVQDGVQTSAELTLKDPMVEVAASGDQNIQECQTSNFAGSLLGRGPANWRWEIGGVPVKGCSGNLGSATDLSAVGLQGCSFTADQFEDLFEDGFETGDCTLWSFVSGGDCDMLPNLQKTHVAQKGLSSITATFRAWDPAAGPETPLDLADLNINISPIGDPAWVNSENPVSVSVSGNTGTLTANANDTGTWDWEFEDPDGGETCTLPGSGTVSCTRETTTGPQTSKSWASEGTYEYRVMASNCRSSVTQVATGNVTIQSLGVQPDIVNFDLGNNASNVCCGGPPFENLKCVAGTSVEVVVDVASTDPSFEFAFDLNRGTNGTADSGSFGANSTPSSVSGNRYVFDVVFGGTGLRWPVARAESGSFQDFHEMFAGASGESSLVLEVVSAGSCP